MRNKLVLLILAVIAAVLVAGVGTAGAYNDGSCTMRTQVRDYSPLYAQGYADAMCDEVVPAISIVACLERSTLGPLIAWSPVSCTSIKVLNKRFYSLYFNHICVGASRHLYRTESWTTISWPDGLGTSGVTVSPAYGVNCG